MPRPTTLAATGLALLVPVLLLAGAERDDRSLLQLCVESAPGAPRGRTWPLRMPGREVELVSLEPPVLDARVVASAEVSWSPDGAPRLRLVLTTEGRESLVAFARMFEGRRLGVVVDGVLRAAPVLRASKRYDALVVGGFSTEAEAARLAVRLGPPATPGGQPAPSGDSALLRGLQGTWVVRSLAVDGRLRSDAELDGATVTFRGAELAVVGRDGRTERYSVAAEAGPPLALRLEPLAGARRRAGWMIAETDGERLTLAFADDLASRPEDFTPAQGKLVARLSRFDREGPSACDLLVSNGVEQLFPGARRDDGSSRGASSCTFVDGLGQTVRLVVAAEAGREAFEREAASARQRGGTPRPEAGLGPSGVSILRGGDAVFLTLDGETLVGLWARTARGTPGDDAAALRALTARVLHEVRRGGRPPS